jgi:hypothetical protein
VDAVEPSRDEALNTGLLCDRLPLRPVHRVGHPLAPVRNAISSPACATTAAGGRVAKAKPLTGVEDVSSRPVRRIVLRVR